ncbi:MAG: class II aldolase/adducin family protein [Phycisphaerae bacterium]
MSDTQWKRDELIRLAHELGREERKLAILGEGNVSSKLSDETFLVKASGTQLSRLGVNDLTECRFAPLLELLDRGGVADDEVEQVLLASRVNDQAKKPSVEAAFHAYLLTLPGVQFVAHCHPIAVNGILCSPRADDFATKRTFPDEVVCCSRESVLVDYTDPGVPLARAIRTGVQGFGSRYNDEVPRVILLKNHGLIAPAAGVGGCLAATLMAQKAAEIFIHAAALGGPTFLSDENVARIEGRTDEHYRRKQLNL